MPERNQFMYPTFGWFGGDERTQFKEYQKQGGGLGFNAWLRQGKPSPPTAISPYAAGVFERPRVKEAGITVPPGVIVAPQTQQQARQSYIAAQQAAQAEIERLAREAEERAAKLEGGTYEKALADFNRLGGTSAGYSIVPHEVGGWTVQFNPSLVETARLPTTYPQFGQDPYGGQGQFNPYTGQWMPPSGYISPAEQAEIDYRNRALQQQREETERAEAAAAQQQQEQMAFSRQQAQMQQAEQERQYSAQLASSPMSWLQYHSYTGEHPVIQPWQLPLMPQQYAGMTAGEKLPGWQGRGGAMTALPGLTTPSAQYWARMGPTAQQQYMGYQQGQGGINPMETQFRLQAQAPPGGRNYGLTWGR